VDIDKEEAALRSGIERSALALKSRLEQPLMMKDDSIDSTETGPSSDSCSASACTTQPLGMSSVKHLPNSFHMIFNFCATEYQCDGNLQRSAAIYNQTQNSTKIVQIVLFEFPYLKYLYMVENSRRTGSLLYEIIPQKFALISKVNAKFEHIFI
jgi:hypothetical protein